MIVLGCFCHHIVPTIPTTAKFDSILSYVETKQNINEQISGQIGRFFDWRIIELPLGMTQTVWEFGFGLMSLGLGLSLGIEFGFGFEFGY